MKKLLITTGFALFAMSGVAIAQSSGSTTTPAPTTSGSPTTAPSIHRMETSTTVMTVYSANPADVRASKLMGTNVYNLKDENIGEVNDLVIDNGKTIKAVVVSVGGFLGMGERNVAISPASVMLHEQKDGSVRLVVNTTKDDLKNVTPFNFADVDKAGPDAGKSPAVAPIKK